MDDWAVRSLRATGVCLAASATLILPGVAGVGPSLPLAAALVAFSAACIAARQELASLPTVVEYELGLSGQDLWLWGLGGAAVVVGGPATTAEEVLALGGVVGLLGMANYFLRPLYLFVCSLLRRLVGAGSR
jgi:hypothetical protein